MMFEYKKKIKVTQSGNSKNNNKTNNKNNENHGENIQILVQAPGPKPLPILGNLDIIGRYAVPFQGFSELAKQYGDIYTLFMGGTRCIVVNNLDFIREVLNQNGRFFGGRPDFLRYHKLFGGNRNNCKYLHACMHIFFVHNQKNQVLTSKIIIKK